MVYILNCSNTEVTDFYLSIINDMFVKLGEDVQFCNKIKRCKSKSDIFIVSTVNDFSKAYFAGYRNIILWMQGIQPEESFLNHHSKLRFKVLNIMTKFALAKAKAIFYVSRTMQKFVDEKFKISTTNKSYIMPCFNTLLDVNAFKLPGKYKNNIFAYVGSLSKWQCFNETIEFYKIIENAIPNTELRVYTFSKNEAYERLIQKKVKNFKVDCVSPDKMTEVLSEVKFGFVLRENVSVNNVATPTKLSSYMAAGVIPVFSNCICDFAQRAKSLKYVIEVESFQAIPSKLYTLSLNNIDACDVLKEYKVVFSEYYNREFYIENIQPFLKKLICNCKTRNKRSI